MNYQTYLSFDGKQETIQGYDTPQHTYPLGSLCIGVMDMDWGNWLASARALFQQVNSLPKCESRTVAQGLHEPEQCAYYLVARFYHALFAAVQAVAPAVADLLQGYTLATFRHHNERLKYYDRYLLQHMNTGKDDSGLTFEELRARQRYEGEYAATASHMELYCRSFPELSDELKVVRDRGVEDITLCRAAVETLEYFVRTLDDLAKLQPDLQQLILWTLCGEDGRPIRSPDTRLAELVKTKNGIYRLYSQKLDTIRIALRLYEVPDSKKSKVASAMFYASDTLPALIFLEFVQLCTQNVLLARCANCGRLFLPASVRAIYCGRVLDAKTGATCKDAPKLNYYTKSKSDPVRSLYNGQRNKYNMRCKRAPGNAKMRQEYEEWKKKAQLALAKYELGEISFETLENVLKFE